ncbi:phosphoinositide phosphatase SAC8 isoform X2, partial [Haematococcus lacustris]
PGMRQPSAGSRGCRGQGGAAAAGSAAWLLHRPPARRKLVEELEQLLELRAGGCWSQCGCGLQVAGQPPQPQQQLLHLTSTSCVDTTNLIQADVGNAFVTAALTGVGLMSEGHSLRTHQPALAAALDTLWANHGAVLADQLAGSGCASAAVIRAGGREPQIWDRLQHWAALATRWYGYNFAEARRQDGLDLVTGVFQVRPGVRAPPRRPVQYSVVQLAGVSLVWAVVQLAVFLSALASGTVTHEDLALRVGLPLACAGGMALWVWLNRSAYVEKPVLAPELTDLVGTNCK